MTESTGFAPVPDEEPDESQSDVVEPDESQAEVQPVPEVGADPQEVAEQAAAAEPLAGNDEQPATPEPNWLLDMRTQHPDSALLAAIEWLYEHVSGK